MSTFAEHRGRLSNANVMLMIGGIPPGHTSDRAFQPAVSNYGLHSTFYTMSSYLPQFSNHLNAADGDTVPLTVVSLPWYLGGGEVLTVADGVLRTTLAGEVMLIRNGSPTPPATLLDAVSFDPNVNQVEILKAFAQLQLKWGDVLVVKNLQTLFHAAGPANTGPSPLSSVSDTWAVYVCLPEFHGGPEAHTALRMPGVIRSIRERVEGFISMWDAQWTSATGLLTLSRNGPRQQAYVAKTWDVLDQHTSGVKLPGPWWADRSDDDESAIDQLSAMAVTGKRGAADTVSTSKRLRLE